MFRVSEAFSSDPCLFFEPDVVTQVTAAQSHCQQVEAVSSLCESAVGVTGTALSEMWGGFSAAINPQNSPTMVRTRLFLSRRVHCRSVSCT